MFRKYSVILWAKAADLNGGESQRFGLFLLYFSGGFGMDA